MPSVSSSVDIASIQYVSIITGDTSSMRAPLTMIEQDRDSIPTAGTLPWLHWCKTTVLKAHLGRSPAIRRLRGAKLSLVAFVTFCARRLSSYRRCGIVSIAGQRNLWSVVGMPWSASHSRSSGHRTNVHLRKPDLLRCKQTCHYVFQACHRIEQQHPKRSRVVSSVLWFEIWC